MSQTITTKKVVTHPYFALFCFLTLCVFLPQYGGSYGGVAAMVGSASLLSVFVAVMPENFRTRSGSMMPARCLIAVMWAGAAVIAVMTLTGQIRN